MVKERPVISVGVDQWRRGEKGEVLFTDGVASCAAVALSNTSTKRGFLGHFSPGSRGLAAMIEAALTDAANPRDITSWAGGFAPSSEQLPGEPSLEVQNRTLLAFRVDVTGAIARAGFRHNRTLWLPPSNQLVVGLESGTKTCRLLTDYDR